MLNTISILDRCTIEGGSSDKRPIYIWHKAFNSISVQRPLSVYFFVPHDSHIQAGSATSAQGITRWPQNFFHHMASQPAISYQPKEKNLLCFEFLLYWALLSGTQTQMATPKKSQKHYNYVQIMFKGYLSLGKVHLRGKANYSRKVNIPSERYFPRGKTGWD